MAIASRLRELLDSDELEAALSEQKQPVTNGPRTAVGGLFRSISSRREFDLQIDALLPTIKKISPTNISLSAIDPNPFASTNVTYEISHDTDPVIVRRVQSESEELRYQLFSGMNKIHASRVLGLNDIDCYVLELSDEKMKWPYKQRG